MNVLVGDADPDAGDTLTVTSASPAAAHGTVACTTAGVCTYTPAANYNGPDGFDYTISDGKGGTDTGHVTITVTPVNDNPDAVNDSLTTSAGTAKDVNVLANDFDIDGDSPLTVTTASPTAAHGTVSCTATGACTYTPNPGYVGSDSFTYTISDGHSGTDTGLVNVTVSPVNAPPDAVDDSFTTPQDTALSVNVFGNDTDDGAFQLFSYTQPAHGSAHCTIAGDCTYTPAAGYVGPDSFTYTIADGHGGGHGHRLDHGHGFEHGPELHEREAVEGEAVAATAQVHPDHAFGGDRCRRRSAHLVDHEGDPGREDGQGDLEDGQGAGCPACVR